MRNIVDPNQCPEDAHDMAFAPEALKVNVEDALTSDPNPHDSFCQQGTRPWDAARCTRCWMRCLVSPTFSLTKQATPGLRCCIETHRS
jgi:hypothetical protein